MILIAGFLMMMIAKAVFVFAGGQAVYIVSAFVMAAQICSYLAVLNLLPVPPFDGFYIIAGLLPRKAAIWMETNAQIINFVVLILLISGALSVPLSKLAQLVMDLMNILTMWIH